MSEFLAEVLIVCTGWNVIALIAGAAWGLLIGALPGITGAIGLALLLPFTYVMVPETAIILLCASYCGSMFGGSIASILLGVPGTASSAATLVDGRPLYHQGKGGLGVGVALVASVSGGMIGACLLILFCRPLASVALSFGAPEYLMLGLFGLTIISALSKNMLRGFIAGIFGMMAATVGLDVFTGLERYTFGQYNLLNGIDVLPALIGLFAISEILDQSALSVRQTQEAAAKERRGQLPSLSQLKSLWRSIGIGGIIGTVIGIMPGAGGSIATWVAYSQAKNISRHPELFGQGSLEGVAAPEAANSASEGGALVPTLALGIPGSNSTAIMMGALTLHGITPGPMLFVENINIINGIYTSVLLANIVVLALGFLVIRPVLLITQVKVRYVTATIFLLIFTGAFALNNNVFDMKVSFFFGVLGLIMRKYEFPLAACVLGIILGPIIEPALNRSLLMSNGDLSIFVTRPISLAILIITIIFFLLPFLKKLSLMRNNPIFQK